MSADRADALAMLDQAEQLRTEASLQPLGSEAPRLRQEADFLTAAARHLLRQLHRAEAAGVQS